MVKKILSGKFKVSDINAHERITIIGKTGTGKSVLFDKIIQYFSKKTLVVLLDTKREYKHIASFELENQDAKRGLFRVYEIEYKGVKFEDPMKLAEFLSALLFERKNCILAVEELGNVVKKYGRLYDVMPNYAKLISQGRSQGVGFIGTTQRPQMIHTTILSQSDHLICFDLTSTQDIEAVKGYFEAEWLEELGKHQFLHLNYKQNYIKKCFKQYLTQNEKKFYNNIFGKP